MSKESSIAQDVFNNNKVLYQEYPHEITKIDEKINKELLENFTGERTTFVQIGPKNYFFPGKFLDDATKYYNFEVRSDDIWIVTFPRSGTTWTQEMVWLLANNLDYKAGRESSLNERCPFLEFGSFVHDDVKAEFLAESAFCPVKRKLVEDATFPEYSRLPLSTRRRIIKTHLPFSLLPPDLFTIGCKVIYVARNPKDVITSFYHLNKLFRTQGYKGNLEKYCEYFIRNLQPWTPYWEHIKEGWSKRRGENVLFMFYENMLKESKDCIRQVAHFLGKNISEEEVDKLDDHLNIRNFKNNPSVNNEILKEIGIVCKDPGNGFIRNGKSGGWRDEMDRRTIEKVDRWIAENLKDVDIRFPEQI